MLFVGLFSVVGFVTLQIPFTKLFGSNVSFTLFDFFGPIAGAFLGPFLGIASVLGVQLVNYGVHDTALTTGSVIRLFPTLFAVYYFAVLMQKSAPKHILAAPLISMLVFWAHPEGRAAWYYPLFWLIPLVAYFKKENLLLRSLGATFTAHAVGGAAWIWAFNLPASVWNSLISLVIVERSLFALGIAGSYLAVKHTLSLLTSKGILPALKNF